MRVPEIRTTPLRIAFRIPRNVSPVSFVSRNLLRPTRMVKTSGYFPDERIGAFTRVHGRSGRASVGHFENRSPNPSSMIRYRAETPSPQARQDHLDVIINSYCVRRGFSPQQRRVLEFYLQGRCDKEVATLCACAETTVYEHWRRMARKMGGTLKSDVISDFHRFLAGG